MSSSRGEYKETLRPPQQRPEIHRDLWCALPVQRLLCSARKPSRTRSSAGRSFKSLSNTDDVRHQGKSRRKGEQDEEKRSKERQDVLSLFRGYTRVGTLGAGRTMAQGKVLELTYVRPTVPITPSADGQEMDGKD